MTTLFYKALILQGEIWCWSLLGLKGLRLRHSLLTIHSLPQAKGHHLGRENSSAPLTAVFCNLVTYLQTYGKALQQHKQQYPHFLNEADRSEERLHFQLLWLQRLLCPGLVHRALLQQHAGCSQWDSIEAEKRKDHCLITLFLKCSHANRTNRPILAFPPDKFSKYRLTENAAWKGSSLRL